MNIKKLKIIDIILFILLSVLIHNVYKWFPSILTSIFAPVNESIYEHMKIFSTSYLIIYIFDQIIIDKYKLKVKSNLFNFVFSIIINIVLFLLFYLPVFFTKGENLILTLLILYSTGIITSIISYYILKYLKKRIMVLPLSLMIIFFIINITLTYKPPHNIFFYDTVNNIYSLNHRIPCI